MPSMRVILLILPVKIEVSLEKPGVNRLIVEIGFYADISQESRCNSEIKVWAHFYKILVFI